MTSNPNGLAEALAGKPLNVRLQRCALGRVLVSIDKPTADLLAQRVNDPAWSDRVVAAILADAGHVVGGRTIGDHRRNICHCAAFDLAETQAAA